MADADERLETRDAFEKAVDMSPSEIGDWLETGESRSVGWSCEGESAAAGHKSG